LGCSGVSVGEDGDGDNPCHSGTAERVADPSQPPGDFKRSADGLLADANGVGTGWFELEAPGTSPRRQAIEVELAVMSDSLRFEPGRGPSGQSATCPDRLTATVGIVLDAPDVDVRTTADLSIAQSGSTTLAFSAVDGVDPGVTLSVAELGDREDRSSSIAGHLALQDGTWRGHLTFQRPAGCAQPTDECAYYRAEFEVAIERAPLER
jgi:hypothetical protein